MLYKIQGLIRILVSFLSGGIALFVLATLCFSRLDREGAVYNLTGRVLLEDYVNNFACFVIIFAVIILWKMMRLGKWNPFVCQGYKKQLFFLSVVLLLIQIYFLYHINFYAGFDVHNLKIATELFVNGQFDEFYNLSYFQTAPNNLMIYMVYIILFTIAKVINIDGYILLLGLNIILANIAVALSAVATYILTKSKLIMWIVYGVSVIMFGVSPWLSVPYTDMFSITIPIFSFYLYLCIRDKQMSNVLKWFCILAISFLGYGLKPLNAIIAIAIILCEVLCFQYKKDNIKNFSSFLIAIMLVFCVTSITQTGIEKSVGYQKDEEKVYSLAWVLFLGSDRTTYGQWSYDNFEYAGQFVTKAERDSNMLRVTAERLSEMGCDGYVSHLMNKIHIFYGDGNIGWGRTGSVIYETTEEKNVISHILRNIIYPPENYDIAVNYPGYGDFFKYYTIIKQFIWLLLVAFMTIGICRSTMDKRILVLKITWIGVFLFTMMFETHARLLISYLPIFVVVAGVGASQYVDKEKTKR